MANAKLKEAGEAISYHLNCIRKLFRDDRDIKLTLLVRSAAFPDGSRDMLMTSDSTDEAIKALGIIRDREEAARPEGARDA